MTLEQRFWSKVQKTETCWLWKAAKSHGYGVFGISRTRKVARAHRVSWELANKAVIPEGMHVCHTCDNPGCVNPSHLFIGTRTDNIRDCIKKNRFSCGEKHSKIMEKAMKHAKMKKGEAHYRTTVKEEDVIKIRALYPSKNQAEIGKIFGLTNSAIWRIVHRKNWKHI